eukprot:7011203-Lingulodinium_polyedra.AAC.1
MAEVLGGLSFPAHPFLLHCFLVLGLHGINDVDADVLLCLRGHRGRPRTQTHTGTHRDTHKETHRDTQRHTETHRDTLRHTETH